MQQHHAGRACGREDRLLGPDDRDALPDARDAVARARRPARPSLAGIRTEVARRALRPGPRERDAVLVALANPDVVALAEVGAEACVGDSDASATGHAGRAELAGRTGATCAGPS